MAGTVSAVSSVADLHATYAGHQGLTTVLLWAPWHPPSVNLAKVLDALAAEQRSVRFAKVNTDVCPSIASSLGADQVPFVAFLGPDGKQIDSVAGADPPKLVEKVKSLAGRTFAKGAVGGSAAPEGEDLNARLKGLVNFSPVMLFIKGSKDEPFCKFSKECVGILNKQDVEYSTFDILQDEEVRQGLKDFSNWKTYPQLYISGELIGGVDIIKEMDEDGSLADAFPKDAAPAQSEEDKLKALINQAPVMLFMKGNPAGPKCGFSRKISELLTEKGIAFESFDILQDEDVRQGLKTYSNWPTFPQLYGTGRLVGGLDIVKELADDGSLEDELGISK